MSELLTEFLIFSDLHAHNFRYAADRTTIPGRKGLYNSRLADTVGVLNEIREYADYYKIEKVVFCGDLFHRRTSVPTDVRHVIFDSLREFGDYGIDLYAIPGNHDMGDRRGYVHNLAGLESDFVKIFDNGLDKISFGEYDFIFIPYTDDIEEAKRSLRQAGDWADKEPAILFAHLGMQGAKVGSDYVLISDSDVSSKDVPNEKFAACFFGHFHEHQQLFENGWFVGATHQHNWGDAYGSRGFLHVKLFKDGTVDFEQIGTMAPDFVVTRDGKTSRGELSMMKENDFVRNITKDPYQDKEALKERWGIHHLELVAEPKEEEGDFKLDSSKLSPIQLLEDWVDHKKPDVDRDALLSVGKDILKDVGL